MKKIKNILIAALLLLSMPAFADYPNKTGDATDNWLKSSTQSGGRGIGGEDTPNGDVKGPNGDAPIGDCLWLVILLSTAYIACINGVRQTKKQQA
jgi:hypothetical protein